MNPWMLWQLLQQVQGQNPWAQMGTPWVNPLPVNTQLPQPSPSAAGGAVPGTSSGASPAAQAQGPTPNPSFQDYLSMMYPSVTGWSNTTPPGLGAAGPGSISTNQWSGMFTPPAGTSRQPQPINVMGPSSLSSPFVPLQTPERTAADREG